MNYEIETVLNTLISNLNREITIDEMVSDCSEKVAKFGKIISKFYIKVNIHLMF